MILVVLSLSLVLRELMFSLSIGVTYDKLAKISEFNKSSKGLAFVARVSVYKF